MANPKIENESLVSKNYDEFYIKHFDILKSQVENIQDASRKSSIDIRIRDIVDSINNSENYFTTSSCSGRFIVFSQVNYY
jgi:tRNA(Phe) wybutosine-synthesizing methylase Tyw3